VPTIYTVGYARLREPERLAHLAAELDAVVVDVRFKPYTSFKGWSRADLHARLGSSYRWVEAFGNEGYRGGPVRLHDAARGLADVTPLLEVGNIILLCGRRPRDLPSPAGGRPAGRGHRLPGGTPAGR